MSHLKMHTKRKIASQKQNLDLKRINVETLAEIYSSCQGRSLIMRLQNLVNTSLRNHPIYTLLLNEKCCLNRRSYKEHLLL